MCMIKECKTCGRQPTYVRHLVEIYIDDDDPTVPVKRLIDKDKYVLPIERRIEYVTSIDNIFYNERLYFALWCLCPANILVKGDDLIDVIRQWNYKQGDQEDDTTKG